MARLKGNDMENREPTPDEIANALGKPPEVAPTTPLAPYDRSRDADDPADHPLAENYPGGPVLGAATAAGVTPDLLERLTKAMESIGARQPEAAGNNEILAALVQSQMMLVEAIKGLGAGQRAMTDITQRAQLPENKFGPDISDFNPRGERQFPRPDFKCQILAPWPLAKEDHSREEIELWNLVVEGGQREYMVTRNDRTKIKVAVKIITKLESDEPSRLILNHETAYNNDYHRLMPGMVEMLRQMCKQHPSLRAKAAGVISMEEEVALIEAGN